jgi:hypothetical protein
MESTFLKVNSNFLSVISGKSTTKINSIGSLNLEVSKNLNGHIATNKEAKINPLTHPKITLKKPDW